MNQNSAGAPDREDIRILEQLRRQLIPMIAVMDNLQGQMQAKMHRGEAVDWPQIHRATTVVTSYLNSFNVLMNGGYKHTSEDIKVMRQVPKEDANGNTITNEDGTAVLENKELTKTEYRDLHIPAHGERVKALHPYPIPPFPITQPFAGGMANALLRKRLEPMEEGWVEQRLKKAAEFAHVPESWGIEPKRPDANEKKDEQDSDDDEDANDSEDRMPTKRVKGSLSEDDILEMWKYAHQEAFDQDYLKAKYPTLYGGLGEGDGEDAYEAEDGEEEEDDDDDEDDFEDVMDTSDTPDGAAATSAAVADPALPQKAAQDASPVKPAVHKPVPGLPVLSLGFVHKFMASGEATGQ